MADGAERQKEKIMQITNAIKKLNKAGFAVTQNGRRYSAQSGRNVIEFKEQDSLIICIRVRNANDRDDVQSDYSAGVWCNNLSKAIRLAN